MTFKQFDKELYKKYDKISKDKVIELVEKLGYTVKENSSKIGVDLQVYNKKEELIFNIECETKLAWVGSDFKYPDLNLPLRKEKYCKLEVPTLFVIFNSTQSSYYSFTDSTVLNSPLKEVRNKFVLSGEKFFKIDLNKVNRDIKYTIKEILNERT